MIEQSSGTHLEEGLLSHSSAYENPTWSQGLGGEFLDDEGQCRRLLTRCFDGVLRTMLCFANLIGLVCSAVAASVYIWGAYDKSCSTCATNNLFDLAPTHANILLLGTLAFIVLTFMVGLVATCSPTTIKAGKKVRGWRCGLKLSMALLTAAIIAQACVISWILLHSTQFASQFGDSVVTKLSIASCATYDSVMEAHFQADNETETVADVAKLGNKAAAFVNTSVQIPDYCCCPLTCTVNTTFVQSPHCATTQYTQVTNCVQRADCVATALQAEIHANEHTFGFCFLCEIFMLLATRRVCQVSIAEESRTKLRELEERMQRHCEEAHSTASRANQTVEANREETLRLQAEVDQERAAAEMLRRQQSTIRQEADAVVYAANVEAARASQMVEANREVVREHAAQREQAEQVARQAAAQARANQRTCIICFDNYDISAGIECHADVDKHFLCNECFEEHVKTESETEAMDLVAQREGRVFCPNRQYGCEETPPFSDAEVARHCSDAVFVSYTNAKKKLVETRLAQEIGAQERARMDAELQRLQKMTEEEREVEKERRHIEDMLNLKCPRCKMVFVDFTNCAALTCAKAGCGCGFCAWCQEDCGGDAHQHVANCSEKPPGADTFYDTKDEFMIVQRRRQRAAITAYLRDNVKPVIQPRVAEACRVVLTGAEMGGICDQYSGVTRGGVDPDHDEDDFELALRLHMEDAADE
jgi:hypothetical protein